MLNITIKKNNNRWVGHSEYEKYLFRLSTILAVRRNNEERGRPSKSLQEKSRLQLQRGTHPSTNI